MHQLVRILELLFSVFPSKFAQISNVIKHANYIELLREEKKKIKTFQFLNHAFPTFSIHSKKTQKQLANAKLKVIDLRPN